MSSNADIVVRLAGPADADAIITFSAAMALETEDRQLDITRLREGTLSLLATPTHGFFMVAEAFKGEKSRLVGQMMITYEWSDWRNGMFWWVQSVYVHPEWRRQGVYRHMYETILAQAKSDPGVCGIRLYVEQGNHTAQAVYQRVGLAPSAYTVYEKDFIFTDTVPTRKHT